MTDGRLLHVACAGKEEEQMAVEEDNQSNREISNICQDSTCIQGSEVSLVLCEECGTLASSKS